MKLAPITVTAALLAAGAGWAATAPADAAVVDALGSYSFEADDGETATWTLTPCGNDADHCVHVAETGNSKRAPWSADANWTVGSWIMFAQQPDAILCKDGGSAPGQNTYSWDGTSLSGSASIFSNGACGTKAESLSIPFKLVKKGSAPAAPPAAPVETSSPAPAAKPAVAAATPTPAAVPASAAPAAPASVVPAAAASPAPAAPASSPAPAAAPAPEQAPLPAESPVQDVATPSPAPAPATS